MGNSEGSLDTKISSLQKISKKMSKYSKVLEIAFEEHFSKAKQFLQNDSKLEADIQLRFAGKKKAQAKSFARTANKINILSANANSIEKIDDITSFIDRLENGVGSFENPHFDLMPMSISKFEEFVDRALSKHKLIDRVEDKDKAKSETSSKMLEEITSQLNDQGYQTFEPRVPKPEVIRFASGKFKMPKQMARRLTVAN